MDMFDYDDGPNDCDPRDAYYREPEAWFEVWDALSNLRCGSGDAAEVRDALDRLRREGGPWVAVADGIAADHPGAVS